MGKYFGKIGYRKTVETKPSVWVEEITEREYYGDVLEFGRRLQSSDKVNDNIALSERISIVADPFAVANFQYMLYLEHLGVRWRVSNVEVQYPRLILTLGEVYNG